MGRLCLILLIGTIWRPTTLVNMVGILAGIWIEFGKKQEWKAVSHHGAITIVLLGRELGHLRAVFVDFCTAT